ncbi:hypothetical protein EPN16_01015 [bacterium]|nr:MAG: hypothetical protein EPN16_01015 [bacterium]
MIRHKLKALTPDIMQRAYVKYAEFTDGGIQQLRPDNEVEVFNRFQETIKKFEDEELADVPVKNRPSRWLRVESLILGIGDISRLDGDTFQGGPVFNTAMLEPERIKSELERIKLTFLQEKLREVFYQLSKEKEIPQETVKTISETIKNINETKLDITNVPPRLFTFTNEVRQYLVKHVENGGNELVSSLAYFIHRRDSVIDGMGFPVTDENREIFIADLKEIEDWKNGLEKTEVYSHSDIAGVSLDNLIWLLEKGFVDRINILRPPLSDTIRIEYVRKEQAASAPAQSSSPLESSAVSDKVPEYGGIDLSEIEVTLKDEKFVSNLNPADLKVLRAAKYLKEGWSSLSLLYVHEIMLLLKDNLASDIKQKGLLREVLNQLQVKGFVVPEIKLALAS